MQSAFATTLSLLIPTRERAATLAYTLATAIAQSSTDYEIIVSDNASDDDTRRVVGDVLDRRIRYYRTDRRLSMCDNYEFALSHAQGLYVLIIGDDDAVIPGALDILLRMLRESNEPIAHMWPLHTYDWPDSGRRGRVAYLAPTIRRHEVDLKAKARAVIQGGGWKYYELPSPYHAAVPRHLLDVIRERTGRVFHSTQPDVFTAMAIPALADRAVNIGFTVTFNGRSMKSNGLGFVAQRARQNIDRFLAEYGDYRFHPTLYFGASGAANMIPDAILVACDLFPELYRSSEFNYEAMWAFSCRHGFTNEGEVLMHRAEIRQKHGFRSLRFLRYAIIHKLAAARRRLLDVTSSSRELDTAAAENILELARALAARGAGRAYPGPATAS